LYLRIKEGRLIILKVHFELALQTLKTAQTIFINTLEKENELNLKFRYTATPRKPPECQTNVAKYRATHLVRSMND
jgi:hypothetical protein